jgi:hypothetical protein
VQFAEGVQLVDEEVAFEVQADGVAARTFGPGAQGGLLGHDPAGHEHGGRLAEQCGDFLFQVGDLRADPAVIGKRVEAA